MGCTAAIVFTCFGASYGTAKSGVGICSMGVLRPDLIVKSMALRLCEGGNRANKTSQTSSPSLWLVSSPFMG